MSPTINMNYLNSQMPVHPSSGLKSTHWCMVGCRELIDKFNVGIEPFITHPLYEPDTPFSPYTGVDVLAGEQTWNN